MSFGMRPSSMRWTHIHTHKHKKTTPTQTYTDTAHKRPRTIVGDDGVRVVTAVLVDVLDGLVHVVHHLNGALQATVLRPQRG